MGVTSAGGDSSVAGNSPASLTALTPDQFKELLLARKLPGFRAAQIWEWVWKKGVLDYAEMSNLPKDLRTELSNTLPVTGLTIEKVQKSKRDGTIKALLKTPSGFCIESVVMPDEESGRTSVCVSTQIGCAMGCAFCASAIEGIKGQLQSSEILDQVLLMGQLADERPSNVVLMGMGEPLANYDRCLEAVKRINSPDYLHIGARHITLSTVGLVEKMERLADEWPPVKLAVSLHAPNDKLRRRIIPAARATYIAEILEVASGYAWRTSRDFTVEYALIAGLNADRKCAEELAVLLRRRPAKINLITLNPGGTGKWTAPSTGRVKAFRDVLKERGLEVTIRKRRGTDIDAACGQLRLRDLAGKKKNT
jgi:23S rRNA (adenine2503-C2)-methyltransferase